MTDWKPENAVERRFIEAHQDWMRFARKPDARLLYWYADTQDLQMVKLYLEMQAESSCTVIEFTEPYIDHQQYCSALATSLINFYMERKEGAAQMGINANWQPPIMQNKNGSHYLFDVAQSLMHHHPDVFPGFVFIFTPTGEFLFKQFEKTLLKLLNDPFFNSEKGNCIRMIVTGDIAQTDKVPSLPKQKPDRVIYFQGHYHMLQMPRELLAESTERGDSAEFRRLFVQLGETLHNNNTERMEQLHHSALAISEKNNWPDQSVVICLTTGAGMLKAGEYNKALNAYQQSLQFAKQALAVKHPAGNKLIINAKFGEASVWLMQKEYLKAALCYGKTVPYAKADNDGILCVEAYRMQAWCLEQAGSHTQAIDAAFNGLKAGKMLPESVRGNCNLTLLIQWVAERLSIGRQQKFRSLLSMLFGKDWLEQLRPKSPELVSLLQAQEQQQQEAQ